MFILYTTEDGKSPIQLRAKGQTVRRSQREMAKLFGTSTDNIGLHLRNIYEDGELRREATTEGSSVVQSGGISHAQMDAATAARYLKFDQKCPVRKP